MHESASQQELESWVLHAAPIAIAYARSLLRQKDMAEDIVQDCFLRLWAKRTVYDLPRDGMKLLYRSISNACINHTTRQKTMTSFSQGQENDATTPDYDPADLKCMTAIDQAEYGELAELVAEAMQTLPPMQRAAIELRSLGYSQQEIGEILQVSASNAGVLIHRGRQQLATQLAPYLSGEPNYE